jgi:hypothetical protein
MRHKIMRAVQAVALLLACSTMLAVQVDAGQGRGKGRRKRDGVTVALTDRTPGTPTSPRGRGRNTDPGTSRGRFVRSVGTTKTNRRNPAPGTPRRRRVRRGHARD